MLPQDRRNPLLPILMIEFTETLHDTLFPDFIHSTKAVGESYAADCQQLREMNPEGLNVSLKNGWHSKLFGMEGCGVDRLDNLMTGCLSYANEFLGRDFNRCVKLEEWWVNIGGHMAFNNIHIHGRATVIGVYFVKVPEGSGDLVLQRNDGSAYTDLYDVQTFEITPEENRFYIIPGHLWHWVNVHEGVEDRISISMNYY